MTPDGWFQTTLEQVADVAIGRTPARDEKSNWDPGKTTQNRWATIANIKGKFIGETTEYISDLGVQHSNARLVPPGTLLMSFKLSLGRVAITSTPMYTNEAIAAFYPNGLANTEYLYYLLPTLALEESSDRAVKGQTLNKAKLRALQLVLPPADEQRKIAAILSSVDDAIEKTQAVIDQVQVVKRGLMQELLTRGLPGRHTRFRQTEIGEIPEAWRLLPLECFIEDGPDNGLYRPQRNYGEGTPIVRIDAFDNGVQLRRPQLRRVFLEPRDVERFAVNPGDILINRVNSMSHLAKCALAVSFDEPTVYESNIMRLSLDDSRLTTEFGFRWLSSEQVKTHLRRKAKRAVAQASINQNDVLTIPTPCPPRAEQRRIAEVIGIIEQRLESETDALEGLTKFKLALMSVVLTGELRVTPDPETI